MGTGRMITYKTSRLDRLPLDTLKKLKTLTFRNNGVMYDHLEITINRIEHGNSSINSDEWLVLAYDDKIFQTKPIGWSMSFSVYRKSNRKLVSFIGVFVKKKYRRKGIGTILVKQLDSILKSKKVKQLVVSPHDKTSIVFYKSLGAKEGKVDYTIG